MYTGFRFPLRNDPGQSGLFSSCSGIDSTGDFSTCPDQGLRVLCGDTRIQSSFNGLYLTCGSFSGRKNKVGNHVRKFKRKEKKSQKVGKVYNKM